MARSVRDGRPKILQPVHPNVGVEVAYRRKLDKLIEEMHRSLQYWIGAAYRANPPEMAQDDSPARTLRRLLSRLINRWQARFDQAAEEMARYFATQAIRRSQASLESILRRGGFSVRFRQTRAVNDVLQAAIGENVALIRSIAQQHLAAVEGHVLRSVGAGRDIATLRTALQQQFGVTRRRAALIARDQNNKATAVIQRVRQQELGINEVVWVHSGGGREPRPSHVRAGRDRVRYDPAVGWLDPHEGRPIFPGELINCRCVGRPVLAGLS